MEQMAFQQETGRAPETTIFRLDGPLTLSTLFGYQEAARDPRLKNVIVDLSGTPYMDSAGLGAILSQWAHCQRHGLKFAIAGVPPRIKTLLEVTKTSTVLPQHPTAEAADQAFA